MTMPKSLLLLLSTILIYVFICRIVASFCSQCSLRRLWGDRIIDSPPIPAPIASLESPPEPLHDCAVAPEKGRYGEQKIAQFRTHDLTKVLSYVSTQSQANSTHFFYIILDSILNWPDCWVLTHASLCSPNDDFRRMNKRWNPDFRYTPQCFVAKTSTHALEKCFLRNPDFIFVPPSNIFVWEG